MRLSGDSPLPSVSLPDLPPPRWWGAGQEKENRLELHRAPRSPQVPLVPRFPSKHLWPGVTTVGVGNVTGMGLWGQCGGPRQTQPEATPAPELSTHRQMVWCSNSLLELITLLPEGQLHSGTISHFPAKVLFSPSCVLAALFWGERGAHSWRQERCLSLPPPSFAFGFWQCSF